MKRKLRGGRRAAAELAFRVARRNVCLRDQATEFLSDRAPPRSARNAGGEQIRELRLQTEFLAAKNYGCGGQCPTVRRKEPTSSFSLSHARSVSQSGPLVVARYDCHQLVTYR